MLGLPIDGLPVTSTNKYHWRTVIRDFLRVEEIPDGVLEGSMCSITWLADQFRTLPKGAQEVVVHQHVRAYILLVLGETLFVDKSRSFVHLMFLPLLGDISRISSYSWGSTCLAWLYRELCQACHASTQEIAGPLLLLQQWIWERCPFITPERPVAYIDPMPQGSFGMSLY